jgi:hypothetical protein
MLSSSLFIEMHILREHKLCHMEMPKAFINVDGQHIIEIQSDWNVLDSNVRSSRAMKAGNSYG